MGVSPMHSLNDRRIQEHGQDAHATGVVFPLMNDLLDQPRQTIVIGGGLAGMAAAVALESAGHTITLLEARKALGGRAGSFTDPETGEELDNCQHVLLGCCTNLLDFYDRLKARSMIDFQEEIIFRDGAGKRFSLRRTHGLPAPLHLGASFATFGGLSLKEKIAYGRAMSAMLRMGKAGRRELADVSFGDWLDRHHQPTSLLKKMYDPVLVGALNEDCRSASAEYAIEVFQDAMLAHADGYIVGVPRVPLSQLYGSLPVKDVRLGTRVATLRFDGNRVSGVELSNGDVLPADAVVVATNHHTINKWIPPELLKTDDRFDHLDQLDSVPILGVHLWFDRPVMTEPHTALVEGPLQWLFRKDAAGTAVHGVISAARDWVGKPKDDSLREFEAQIRRTFPEAADAKLKRGVIVIEKRATFSPRPGVDRVRPQQAAPPGGIANLVLAGDYTRTGWPATMEGAVRGGYRAADAVVKLFDVSTAGPSFCVADLPVQWPARLMGL